MANATQEDSGSRCKKDECSVMKAGILITDLTAAGLFPFPTDSKEMYAIFLSYWQAMRRIGTKWRSTACGSAGCYGDFGVKGAAKTMLQQRVHRLVYWYLDMVSLRRTIVLIMLMVPG